MNYNTQRERLPMPEYGRAVQDMVDYALTIQDSQERERCAYTIIGIMGSMFPTLRDVPDFKNKLWDHLAFMSDYKLEIKYPCEITRLTNNKQTPDKIKYSNVDLRFRHYGRIIPELIEKVLSLPEGQERDLLIHLVAVQMKKDMMIWNKDSVDDAHIAKDIEYFSKGKITLKEGELDIAFPQAPPQQFNRKKNKKRY